MFLPLNKIIQLLLLYRYYILFPIAVIEGPIISVIAGFLVSKGFFNFFAAYGVLVIGDLVGDTIYYIIGIYGGRPFIKHWGHYFGIQAKRLQYIETHFEKHAGKTLLFGKTQAIGATFLVAAGMAKMSYPKFFLYNLLGTVIKSVILILIGYYFGQAYYLINQYFHYIGLISIFILALAIAIYFLFRRRSNWPGGGHDSGTDQDSKDISKEISQHKNR